MRFSNVSFSINDIKKMREKECIDMSYKELPLSGLSLKLKIPLFFAKFKLYFFLKVLSLLINKLHINPYPRAV